MVSEVINKTFAVQTLHMRGVRSIKRLFILLTPCMCIGNSGNEIEMLFHLDVFPNGESHIVQ